MSKKKGDLFICEMCKRATVRTSGHQIVCSACASVRYRQQQAQYALEHKKRQLEEPKRKTGSSPLYTIAEMERAARKNGMSYGQYTVALKWGRVDPPEKTKGAGRK